MPNAARLIAALCLAVVAFIVSGQVMPLMPEGTDFGYFTVVNVALGIVVGWVAMGKRAGRGTAAAVTNGLTGIALLVFWALFIQGCYEMFRRAMRNRYDGPFDALMAIFEIGIGYGAVLLVSYIIGTLLGGGIVAGLATEYASKKWR